MQAKPAGGLIKFASLMAKKPFATSSPTTEAATMVIYPALVEAPKSEVEISGKVAIGTTDMPLTVAGRNISSYNLFVRGGILTDELLVKVPWADYVFSEDYSLMSFDDLRSFIALEGHLPNIPAAEEVEADGLEIASMTVLQQEKIEEAFLYILQLEEKVRALEEKIGALSGELREEKKTKNVLVIKTGDIFFSPDFHLIFN
ncbi:MAG: hypothetical protein R3B47_20615 [Bacteroidia bacterium]